MNQKIAIVTGANRGIGLEISRQLGQHGVKVIMTARNEEKGEAGRPKIHLSLVSDVYKSAGILIRKNAIEYVVTDYHTSILLKKGCWNDWKRNH